MTSFKEKFDLEARRKSAEKVLCKFPDRVPVIIELDKHSSLPPLEKTKYLAPRDITVGNFLHIIRQRLKIDSSIAVYVFFGPVLAPISASMGDIYDQHKDEDLYLWGTLAQENCFGSL